MKTENVFRKKNCDKEICSNNSYYVGSDEDILMKKLKWKKLKVYIYL